MSISDREATMRRRTKTFASVVARSSQEADDESHGAERAFNRRWTARRVAACRVPLEVTGFTSGIAVGIASQQLRNSRRLGRPDLAGGGRTRRHFVTLPKDTKDNPGRRHAPSSGFTFQIFRFQPSLRFQLSGFKFHLSVL